MEFKAALRPFGSKPRWPLDMVSLFAINLDLSLRTQIETKFNKHLSPIDLERSKQLKGLSRIFAAATSAKRELDSLKSVVRKENNAMSLAASSMAAQGSLPPAILPAPYPPSVDGRPLQPPPSQAFSSDVSALTSQAEQTINNHNQAYAQTLFLRGF